MIEKILKFIIDRKKKKDNVNRAVLAAPDQDFIPYVCHYDPDTILTKNGELLQVIRITGFGSASMNVDIVSLRDSVREAISSNISDAGVALWFHTIRRKKNIVPEGKFDDFFSDKLNEAWVAENRWNYQYVNELYITVIF